MESLAAKVAITAEGWENWVFLAGNVRGDNKMVGVPPVDLLLWARRDPIQFGWRAGFHIARVPFKVKPVGIKKSNIAIKGNDAKHLFTVSCRKFKAQLA